MCRNSVLGEHMDNKQLCQLSRSYCIVSGNENTLLSESVHNNEDCCVALRFWEVLDEIHRDGIPQPLQNQELF
jgi:hypothetical protein